MLYRQLKSKNLSSLRNIFKDAIDQVKPKKVILFGSYAYGQVHKDSDLDILFIFDKKNISKQEIYFQINNLIEHNYPMDILVKTSSELQKRLEMGDVFFREIIENGKLLYES